MKKNGITRLLLTIVGSIMVAAGIGVLIFYFQYVHPEQQAQALLTEGRLVFERGDKISVNNSIDIFSKIVAKYPATKSAMEAYYYIGQGYEKLSLNSQAYYKYVYILKNYPGISPEITQEIKARLGRLKVLQQQTEEGIDQLLGLVNHTSSNDFRSRVYTELGNAYLKDKLYNKAKKMFDIALSEYGRNEEAILGKARAYMYLGQANNAYDLYEYFLKYYGNFSQYASDVRSSFSRNLYNSGMSSYKSSSYYSAIEYFRRYIRVFPGHSKVENCLYWIGESLFGLKKFDSAIKYFNRVLTNHITTKDEDARIKKGYSYFMVKKFDLAAREFQVYIEKYPHGKHIDTARKWKEMSTKEILYRIEKDRLPDVYEDSEMNDDEIGTQKGSSSMGGKTEQKGRHYGVSGDAEQFDKNVIDQENIMEL